MGFDGFDADLIVVFGFPLLIVALALAYSAYQRNLKHKERMAMIEKGLVPTDLEPPEIACEYRRSSLSPVGVTLVGIAITLGLLTIGVGPWLIGGLVPTAVGCAMLIQQMIEESKKKRDGE